MSRAYAAFTETGLALAETLARALPGPVTRCGHGGLRWRSGPPPRLPKTRP